MKKTVKHSIMAVLAVTFGFCASVAQAQTASDRVYVIDGRGEVATSSNGLCWRTSFWTPAGAAKDPAGCACDKDILEKSVCEPKTASMPGKKAPVAAVAGGKVKIPAEVLFDFNKAVLKPEGKKVLDGVIADINTINLEVVIIVGHADRIGGAAYNQKLSEKRAVAIKQYFVSKAIPANRTYTEGKGSKQPVTTPDQCKGAKSAKVIQCLQPDRRVDIEVIGVKK